MAGTSSSAYRPIEAPISLLSSALDENAAPERSPHCKRHCCPAPAGPRPTVIPRTSSTRCIAAVLSSPQGNALLAQLEELQEEYAKLKSSSPSPPSTPDWAPPALQTGSHVSSSAPHEV